MNINALTEIDYDWKTIAVWVQVIATIIAIWWASRVALKQSRRQHESNVQLLEKQRKDAVFMKLTAFKVLIKHFSLLVAWLNLENTELEELDLSKPRQWRFLRGEVQVLMKDFDAMIMHELPSELMIQEAVFIRSTCRQFVEAVVAVMKQFEEDKTYGNEAYFQLLREFRDRLNISLVNISTEMKDQGFVAEVPLSSR